MGLNTKHYRSPPIVERQSLIANIKGIKHQIFLGVDCQIWRFVTEEEFRRTCDETIHGIGQHTLASGFEAIDFLLTHTPNTELRARWIAVIEAKICEGKRQFIKRSPLDSARFHKQNLRSGT